MPYRMLDSDEIDYFFDEELCENVDLLTETNLGNFSIRNFPSFDFLEKFIKEIPSLYFGRNWGTYKQRYNDSVDFLTQMAIPKQGDVCLVRQLRVYDENFFLKGLKEGKPVGVYWSLFENECDFPIDEEFPDDVRVIISSCFDVNAIDVVKTMLAHMAWGVDAESEIRLFEGSVGVLDEFNVYDLEWNFQKSFDVKGMKVLA